MEALSEPRSLPDPGERFRGLTFRGAPSDRTSVTPAPVPVPTAAWGAAPVASAAEVERCTPEEQAFLEFALIGARQSAENYRLVPLLRRLPACLRALKVDSVVEARRLLEERPDMRSKALDALLIGATSFYRDAPVFDYLDQSVLPRLFERRDRVRVLSAACSDGSELYTVAALLDRRGRLPHAELLGIDCREAAIAKARKGRYTENSLEQFPEALRASYLSQVDGQLQIRANLIAATNWTVGDAIFPHQHETWNLILCRNLAIYLRAATCAALWRNLALALEPGGYLIVGRAEKPHVPALTQVGPCTYRKDS